MAEDRITAETVVKFRTPGSRRSVGTSLAAGDRFAGRYLVIDQLGSGGCGVVYRAKDLQLDREVALKLLRPEGDSEGSTGARELLLTEARLAARLEHPNIVAIHDTGAVDGIPFLTMGLVRGQSLADLLHDGMPIGLPRALAIITQVCHALDHAHRHGVIHRDVKPSNVLLEEGDQVRLVDFGIAARRKDLADAPEQRVSGTAGFIASEVLDGATPGPRSDQFSAAATLYVMLTGRLAFPGATPQEVCDAVRAGNPVPAHVASRSVPKPVSRVVARALSRRPEDRFADARAFVAALRRAALGRRARDLALVVGAALVTLGAVAVIAWALRPLTVEARLIAGQRSALGTFVPVTVSKPTVLHDGDGLWFSEVVANRDARVRVFLLDGAGALSQIHPEAASPADSTLLAGVRASIPSRDRLWLLDDTGGLETVFLVASRAPVDETAVSSILVAAEEAAAASGPRLRGVRTVSLEEPVRWRQDATIESLLRETFPVVKSFHLVHE